MTSIQDRISATEWHRFPQPEWNKLDGVALALAQVMNSWDLRTCENAYDGLLYAVGNNHAGTYYPVVISVLSIFEQLLRDGSTWQRRTILCVLSDLSASFEPEPGFEKYIDEEGNHHDVADNFNLQLLEMRMVLDEILNGNDPVNQKLARSILDDLGSGGAA